MIRYVRYGMYDTVCTRYGGGEGSSGGRRADTTKGFGCRALSSPIVVIRTFFTNSSGDTANARGQPRCQARRISRVGPCRCNPSPKTAQAMRSSTSSPLSANHLQPIPRWLGGEPSLSASSPASHRPKVKGKVHPARVRQPARSFGFRGRVRSFCFCFLFPFPSFLFSLSLHLSLSCLVFRSFAFLFPIPTEQRARQCCLSPRPRPANQVSEHRAGGHSSPSNYLDSYMVLQ